MPPRSKKASAPSAKAGKTKPELTVVQCLAHEGKSPCIQRGLAAEILTEALASTVWHHRDDGGLTKTEFVIAESGIVPTGKANGHFEIGVSVVRLDLDVYDKKHTLDMSLHKFLQTFIPSRDIGVQDQQA